jgi:hypothetical protein
MAEDGDKVLDAIDALEDAADALEDAINGITDAAMKTKLAENLPKLQTLIDSLNDQYSPGS